jgi:hypothetical protein
MNAAPELATLTCFICGVHMAADGELCLDCLNDYELMMKSQNAIDDAVYARQLSEAYY